MDANSIIHHNPEATHIFPLFPIICGIFMFFIVNIITALVFCKIFSKAGYCWVYGLLMLVPIANIIMPFVLAFGD
jgi:hypothetical protein